VKEPAPPFGLTCTPNIPELVSQLGCTIAVSTYQAGKVVFLSAVDEEKLVQLPRTFPHAMALGASGDRMAIAAKDEVIVLACSRGLAPSYPRQPDTYDGLYVPRATYYTGMVDIHGLAWGTEGLWAVVTSFSCLALVDDTHSFVPRWRPPFITAMASEDRCHLNGMALEDGRPVYVTALGSEDGAQSWRGKLPRGGVLMHVPTGEIVLGDLSMPHSPRLYDGELFMLLSATGELVRVDPGRGTYDVVTRLEGFVRGMSRIGDHLFVALSRLRKNSSTFKDLPIAEHAKNSGVSVIHMPTGALVGSMRYEASVDEIFDVQVIPGLRRPGILNTQGDVHRLALTTPEATYWARKQDG
jgi:uncharacterized protein (TIGR03032 family)